MKQTLALIVFLTGVPAVPFFAGGWFMLTLGQPHAHSDPRAHSAAFVVQVYGCSATAAVLSATAEGLVNGRRLSIQLHPVRLAGGHDDVLFEGDSQMIRDWPNY